MKYHLARGETQLGTFSDLDVSSGLRNGRFQPTDLCWTEGMADWQTLEKRMAELAVEAGEPMPPPLPPPPSMGMALRDEVRRDRAEHAAAELPASRLQRLAAWFIDAVVFVGLLGGMFSMVLTSEKFQTEMQPIKEDPQALTELLQKHMIELSQQQPPNALLEALSLAMIALVVATTVLLTLRGQTLGKLLVGIHVVRNADGGRAGFVKAVLLRTVLIWIILSMPMLGNAFWLVDVLLIFRADQRCLHDLVADTKVVRRKPRNA